MVALGEASPFWGCFAGGTLTPLPTAERGAGGGGRVAGGVPPGPAASAPRAGQRRRLAPPPAGAAGGPRPCAPHHPAAPRPRLWPPPGAGGGHRAGCGVGTPGSRGAQCPSAPQATADVAGGLQGLRLRALSVGGLQGDGGQVEQGFRGCVQVWGWGGMWGCGTWDGNTAWGCGHGALGCGGGQRDVGMCHRERGHAHDMGVWAEYCGYGHRNVAQGMGTPTGNGDREQGRGMWAQRCGDGHGEVGTWGGGVGMECGAGCEDVRSAWGRTQGMGTGHCAMGMGTGMLARGHGDVAVGHGDMGAQRGPWARSW